MTATIAPAATADITMPTGMVGFPAAHRFLLHPHQEGVFAMECLDDPDLGFVVIAPSLFFPHYAPVIDSATTQALGLESASDALVLLVVTVGTADRPAHANLLAPLVVNRHTKVASQVVLSDSELPLRAPIPEG
ncbi:MAG: flagellar assembly protein FliW [Austwickia sp.]|nr:flagellar assembly protein FliW [Austwickia sp.]MBK8436488.1 flagellar assembly protein FliW [Austwickia sp.]MBK9102166.1 flagellar assembly protein FliW [Austwickia sp.]